MKKQLLTLALMVLGTVTAFAAMENAWRTGNKYYTETSMWQLTGAPSLFAAGSQNLEGWLTTATMEDGSMDFSAIENYFTTIEGMGPEGQSVIEVVATGAENTGGDIYLVAELQAGNYIVTYKVKGAQDRIMCNPVSIGTNAQRIFLNNDGTVNMDTNVDTGNGGVAVSKYLRYSDEWKEIAYQVTVSETKSLVIRMTNLQKGDEFTDFAVYPVRAAFDSRKIQSILDKMKMFLADETSFPNERDNAQQLIEEYEELLNDPSLDASDAEGFAEDLQKEYEAFMNANTVDISKYFRNFDLGPERETNQSKTVVSGWTQEPKSDRWNRKAASPSIGFENMHINQEAGASATTLNPENYYQTQHIFPNAQVLYVIKAYAHYDWKGTEWGSTESTAYNVNYADTIANSFFINNDTTVMEHLSPSYAKEYTMIGHADEEGNLTIGFHTAGADASNGGDFRFDNIELRVLGGLTEEQVAENVWGARVKEQRIVLAERLATAREYLASNEYVYAKDSLQRALDLALIADAAPDEWTEDCYNMLLTEVNRLKNAWLYVEAQNAEYTTLAASIKTADDNLADETRPDWKNELKAVRDAAKQVYDAVQPVLPYNAEDEGVVATKASLKEQNDLLVAANAEFLLMNASYNTPADITYINPSLTEDKNGTGWTRTRTANTSFGDQGYSYSRGNGANDPQRVYQDVPITKTGVYIFTAICAANNNGKRDSEETGVYLYIGENDSVLVHTNPIQKEWDPGEFKEFAVRAVVSELPESGTIQVGLNAEQNKVCNQIRFGYTTLKFYGPYDKYVQDSIKAVMKPTKDSLQMVINNLTELKNEARNPQNVDVSFLTQALSTAQNVVNNSEDFALIMSQFDLLEAARQQFVLCGVYPAVGKYFDLSFLVKNPTFQKNADDDSLVDWAATIAEEQTFNSKNTILYGKNYTGVEEIDEEQNAHYRTKLTQQLSGLPAGSYQFGFNATFHGDNKNNIFQVVDKQELFITTPADTVAALPIVQEGMTIEGANESYTTDQDNTYLVFSDDVKLLLYDYRHGASDAMLNSMKAIFALGYYLTLADLDVKAGEQPEVGLYLENMVSGDCNFFLATPTLYFFGDDANRQGFKDGIEETVVAPQYAGAIYNLAGQKVSGKAVKGIFIQNGKKFIVK